MGFQATCFSGPASLPVFLSSIKINPRSAKARSSFFMAQMIIWREKIRINSGKKISRKWSMLIGDTGQSRNIAGRYSKVFKDACREIGSGDRKFHNLRDTFAIRLWAVTGDIHYVSKVIGHTSVTMTEKYANFNVRRLISDFPSLSKYIEKRLNIPKIGIVDTFSVDTKLLTGLSLDREYTT